MKTGVLLVILLRFSVAVFSENLGYELVEHRLEDLQVKLFNFENKSENQMNGLLALFNRSVKIMETNQNKTEENILNIKETIVDNSTRLLERLTKLEKLVEPVGHHKTSLDSLQQSQTLPSCKTAHASGVFKLELSNIKVYCEMDSFDGGWLVIQQRVDLKLDFNRNWTEYRNGFGVVGKNEEFWLGLEAIHQITNDGEYELVIEIKYGYQSEKYGYARYSQFHVAEESDKYRLGVGGHSGTLEDYFNRYNNNMKFSTYDSDNDNFIKVNCAMDYTGGWWFNSCGTCNLNSDKPYWRFDANYIRMMIRQKKPCKQYFCFNKFFEYL